MNCSELETLLCDYLDGTLSPAQQAQVERHLAQCPACTEAAQDAKAVTALAGAAAKVEPPTELVTRILYDLASRHERVLEKRQGPWAVLGHLMWPILQPRFAMGMAMTVLSFSMLARVAGIDVRQLSVSDLNPVKIWRTVDNRVYRTWTRGVQFYDSLKIVYEIRSRLGELTSEEDESSDRATTAPAGQRPQPGGRDESSDVQRGAEK